jgi:putative CocE/NonD family hydrolase
MGLGLAVLPAMGASPLGTPPGQARQAASAAPFDYIAQASKLSQPIYGTSVKEVMPVTAHDGEQLYVEVTRPDPAKYGNGPWPVILEASPYHGTVADREGTRMFPDPKDAEGNLLGLTGYFAKRGYAVVMMDLRGTGRSTGCLDHLGPNDQKDLKTVVETLADAPWSNGRVGMTGHSYVGSTPSAAAAQNPRGLATIVPSAGLASMYDHQFNKGVPWNLQYIGPVVAYEGLALSRDLPPGAPAVPVVGGPNGDNAENGPNAQTGCGLPNSAALAGTGQVTGQYEAWHAQRDSSKGAAAADIPVFMIHGANDNAARIPAAEWFFGGRFDRAKDKVWVGQWDHGSTNGRCGDTEGVRVAHPTCRFEQMQYAIHAWFDKHLAGRKVSTGPAVEAFLNGKEPVDVTQVKDATTWGTKVVTDDAWSRPTSRLALYPDATDGSLRTTPPAEAGSTSFNGGVNALLAGAGNGKAVFTSEPFAKDTVFLGLPELVLRASQSVAQVNHLTAALYRVQGDKRELANTCGIQPMLRFGVATPAPVVPGQAMDLPMQCFTAAQWVAAGQHLELEISTRTPHHASFASDPQITVFTGPAATRYSLPTVPGAVLHDDVRLRSTSAAPTAPAPTGPAQPTVTGSVVAPVGTADAAVEPLSVGVFPFTSEAGFDNAALEVLAEPQGVADIDLTLQRKVGEEWEDLSSSATFGLTEVLSAGRLAAGDYRVVVLNYAGVATAVDLTLTFSNTDGVAGGTPDTAVDGAQAGFLPLP